MGLSLGLLFVVAGLTGSVLVFYVEIDQATHPALWSTSDSAQAPWDRALQTLRHAYPDKTGAWRFEVRDDGGPIPARYYAPPETRGRDFAPMLVWLSPDGAEVLRRAYWGETAMTWIYDLHYRLLLGKLGGAIMGWAGLAMVVLLLTGVWAWWPRQPEFRKALRVKSNAALSRRLYDWHKLAGLASILLLLLLTATGAALALPKETDALLRATAGAPRAPLPPIVQWSSGNQLRLSAAVNAAHAALPGARLAWIEAPAEGAGAYRFRFQVSGDPSWRFPHSHVFVHPVTGDVIGVFDVRVAGAPATLKSWLHPLHDGSAGGLFLRGGVFLIGFVPAGLFVTGLVRWKVRAAARA